MADASRFPRLAVPFAIVGAAAGWLSASLCGSPPLAFPVSRPITAACAAVMGALVGALLRRFAVGRRYWYELADPDPSQRPRTDAWWVHVPVLLNAGAVTGVVVRWLEDDRWDVTLWALSGALCTAAFVPTCLAVLAAGRRAQRARLGSIVAGSDRRAVWAIVATLLAVMTLEELPGWLAGSPDWPAPVVVAGLLVSSAGVLLRVLRADERARREARAVLAAGLSVHERDWKDEADAHLPEVDLGLGEQVLAHSAPGGAPYRDRGRTLSLVRGSPEAARAALARAVWRSRLGLLAVGATAIVHALAAASGSRFVVQRLL
jgi:hypothetical protein